MVYEGGFLSLLDEDDTGRPGGKRYERGGGADW